jgi:hypothetical protein
MINTTVTATSVQFIIYHADGFEKLPYGSENYCATLKLQLDESSAVDGVPIISLHPPIPITQRMTQLFIMVLNWAIDHKFVLPKNPYSHQHGANMQLYTDQVFALATVAELAAVANIAEWLDSATVLHLLLAEMREMI